MCHLCCNLIWFFSAFVLEFNVKKYGQGEDPHASILCTSFIYKFTLLPTISNITTPFSFMQLKIINLKGFLFEQTKTYTMIIWTWYVSSINSKYIKIANLIKPNDLGDNILRKKYKRIRRIFDFVIITIQKIRCYIFQKKRKAFIILISLHTLILSQRGKTK